MADVFEDDGFSEVEDVVLFESTANRNNGDVEQEGESLEIEESIDEAMISRDVDLLHPIAKLQHLLKSSHIFDRQLAARNILDVLSEIACDDDEVQTVVSVICQLSDDPEPLVRAEIVDQIPYIANFCRKHRKNLKSVIRQQLIPLTVKHLSDPENRVLQASHSSLIGLLERGLIDKAQLCEWICPLASQQAESVADCVKMDAVTLICRMVPLIEKEIAEKFFLEQFASLCLDSSIGIRQICSANFGKFCKVVGTEATENILLSQFLTLCGDDTWGIRKSCAEVFMDVSNVVSTSTRKEVLPNIFLSLLCDNSRPVRASAYQSLGAVIATFADPKKGGVVYHEAGFFIILDDEKKISSSESARNSQTDVCMIEQPSHKDNEMDTSNHSVNENNSCRETCLCDNDGNASIVLDGKDDTGSQLLLKTVNRTETVSDTNRNSCAVGISKDNSNIVESTNQSSLNYRKKFTPRGANSGDGTNLNNLKEDSHVGIDGHELLLPKSDSDTAAGDQISSSHKMDEKGKDSDCVQSHCTLLQETSIDTPHQSMMNNESESPLVVTSKNGHPHPHLKKENDFNNFQYWRVPILDTELDVDIEDGRSTSIHCKAKVHSEKNDQICSSNLSVRMSEGMETSLANHLENNTAQPSNQCTEKLEILAACVNTFMDEADLDAGNSFSGTIGIVNSSFNEAVVTPNQGSISEIPETPNRVFIVNEENCLNPFSDQSSSDSLISDHKSPYEQDIVPPQLLERYVNMVDPSASLMVDEITRKCAYNFPAVVYTLGRHNWPCVKSVCDALSKDIQWKVRKTVAACLHELSLILGSNIAARDLLPVFLSLVKDVDEVRMGILVHLAVFLKLLNPSERREFLPCIEEFARMDNQHIWRYRYMLAEQMNQMTDLFSPSDVREHFVPIAMWLITDRVSEVRQAAIKLTAVILGRLAESTEPSLVLWLLTELVDKFRQAQKWLWRQTYAFLCQQIAIQNSLPLEMYVSNVVPHLLTLTWDSVPNVRLVVARCLAQTLLPSDYFPSIQKAHYQLLLQVMYSLQSDADSDVRYFANATEAFSVIPQKNDDSTSITMEVLP